MISSSFYPTKKILIGISPLGLLVLIFFFFFLPQDVVGQNGVSITSDEPDPTAANPIPIEIYFEGPVNRDLVEEDFNVINQEIGNFERGIPEFIKSTNDIEIEKFDVEGGLFDFIDLENFLARELGDAVISITQYTGDDIYYLTYGNGVNSLNLISENRQGTSINENDLSSPLDIEANLPNNNQFLYLADKNEQQVNVYNNNATAKLDDFKVPNFSSSNDVGPTGIVTDDAGNIYVAIAFTPDGNYNVEYDKIAVYQPGNYNNPTVFPPDNSGIELDRPYRIAVDKMGRIYVADGGGSTSNGRVLIFDESYNHIHTIEGTQDNIGAPGSIVVDDYGYIYIIDYQDDITFNGIFQNPEDLISEYDKITSTNYSVNIYDSNVNFQYVTEFNQELNLPIDLEIDYCGNILVNNLELTGPAPGFFTGVDINFNFELKTFTRHDNFTAEVIPKDEGEVVVTLNPENDFFPCGPQPEGNFSIVYQPEEDVPTFDCSAPDDLTLELEADCSPVVPDYSEYITNGQNFDNISINQQEDIVGNLMTVTLEVFEGEQYIDNCQIEVALLDVTDPVITSCDETSVEEEIPAGGSFTVPDYTSRFSASDSCDNDLQIVQDPAEGEEISETTTITFIAIDDSDNESEICSFQLIIEEEEQEPPSFSCPDENKIAALALGDNCEYQETDFSSYLTDFQNFENDPYFEQSVFRTDDILTVEINVYDGEGGSFIGDCNFQIELNDVTDPTVSNCTTPDSVALAEGETYNLPNFVPDISATDNCDDNLDIIQDPPANTVITETTEVTITATDDAGNFDSCTFEVVIEKQTPPETNCNDQPVYLDDNGQAQITAEEVYGSDPDLDNVRLNLSQTSFNCSDAGNTVSVTLRVTDNQTGLSSECLAEITVEDNKPPQKTNCAENRRIFTVDYGETGRNVIYEVPQFADNCDDDLAIAIDGPESGEFFPLGDTVVTYTATDEFGNSSSCSFTIEVQSNADEIPPSFTSCPEENIVQSADSEGCGTVVTYALPVVTDNSNEEITPVLVEGYASGEIFPLGPTTVTYRATDGADNTEICSFTVTVVDNFAPQVSCPAPRILNFNPEVGFTVPDYRDEVELSDNCTSEEDLRENLVQDPAPGAVIYTSQQISFTVTDASDNPGSCDFQLGLEEEEELLDIECPGTQEELFDENCQFQVPDYTIALQQQFPNAEFTQSPEVGSIITTASDIIFISAELGEQSDSCTFVLNLTGNQIPVVACPGPKTANFDPEVGYTLPDYRDELEFSENCNSQEELFITQSPAPGEIIYESQDISFTVEDASGNNDSCSFELTLDEDATDVPLEITGCPGPQQGLLDGYCQFTIPDFTGVVSTNIAANITQAPSAGSSVYQDTRVSVIATTSMGEVDICYVEITLDTSLPDALNCPPATEEADYDPNLGYVVGSYLTRYDLDFCNRNFTVEQTPEFGTPITEDTPVNITVSDAAGRQVSCDFLVTVPSDTDRLVARDDEYFVEDNSQLFYVSEQNGILVNDSFNQANLPQIEIISPPQGAVDRDPDGSFTYNPLDNFTGEDSFTYRLNDGENVSEIATVILNVSAGNIAPVANDDFYSTEQGEILDIGVENGLLANDEVPGDNAYEVIRIEGVSNGSLLLRIDGSFVYTAHPDFTGEERFTYHITNDEGQSNIATVTIRVTGSSSNFTCVPDVELQLNGAGEAILMPENVYTGDAGGRTFSLSQTSFNCEDIGENRVTFSYNDGNSLQYCAVNVIVRDEIAPTINCLNRRYAVSIQEGETFTLTTETVNVYDFSSDNCGIEEVVFDRNEFTFADLGTHTINFTVFDAEGNSGNCEFDFVLSPYTPEEVSCVNGVTLELDANGEAYLDINDVYTGDPFGELSVSRTYFTCEDIGVNRERFYYTENGEETFCEFSVTVAENFKPQVSVNNIGININEEGIAVLTEEDLQAIVTATDNCSDELRYEVSRNEFDCSHKGANLVNLTVTDESDNATTTSFTVFVNTPPGTCGTPVDEDDYVFVYPNPNNGSFKINTPSNVVITNIRAYDMRGRFIKEVNYDETVTEYAMSLGEVETAVYVLRLIILRNGREEELIRRVIVRNI